MNITGIGVVTTRGRGLTALGQALEQGWVPPVAVETRGLPAGGLPVYAVPAEALADRVVLAKARRADRFTRMSVLAAADAWADSGLGGKVDPARLGVIVATALGPHVTTFSFLDGILEFGDAAASPTAFSHSVHNAAASYIAMTLDGRGPTLTLTHFHFAFHQALILARAWLAGGRCEAVLVGATEELGAVLQYVCGRMLTPAADGRIKPFAFSATPESVPGEGSAFFVLTRAAAAARYGRVVDVAGHAAVPAPAGGALQVLDACGLAKDETAYRTALMPGVPAAGYAPLFGSLMTGSALHMAAAGLMLQRRKPYANPVPDNPHGVPVCDGTLASPLETVFCTQQDCAGRQMVIHLAG
jgi:3-oxoacyl-[acyl-carrier-protein] synthase II